MIWQAVHWMQFARCHVAHWILQGHQECAPRSRALLGNPMNTGRAGACSRKLESLWRNWLLRGVLIRNKLCKPAEQSSLPPPQALQTNTETQPSSSQHWDSTHGSLANGTFVATGFCCYNVAVLHDLHVHKVRKNIFHKRKLSVCLFSFEQNIILFKGK